MDQAVALEWGCYVVAQKKRGKKPSALDSLVEATARFHNLTVASRNTMDIPDVPTVNPWQDA